MILRMPFVVSWVLGIWCLGFLGLCESQQVPQDEVDVLKQIATTMGATYWQFDAEACEVLNVGLSPTLPSNSEGYVECNCNYNNNTVCHVTKIVFKSLNLPGVLPHDIAKLLYLQDVDFAYNLLTGTFPEEWAASRLNFTSVLVNRLSGAIPKHLANITSLTYLNLEGNQFSGTIPPELGKLTNLKTLMLSSNQLIGELPASFSNLTELIDFRINDNNLSGRIPEYIQNWRQLTKLEMFASGLEGPIPANISLLDMLVHLRISELKGPPQQFPMLRSATGLTTLILRNCRISGVIPTYVWRMRVLEMLDVSFNELDGGIPDRIARKLKLVFVTGNMLSGKLPITLLKDGSNIDLSYNNFTLQGHDDPACQTNMNRHVNLYRGTSTENKLQRILPCAKDVVCPEYKCSFHVNCGGNDLTAKEGHRRVTYEGDVGGDAAGYFSRNSWGFTSSGDFLDEPNYQNSRSIQKAMTANVSGLYSSARLSPLLLMYFYYCLENGSYNVSLHFAEILFTNDKTSYFSLGRRMFDIYIQGELVWENFNIEKEAGGAQIPVARSFNANVTDGTMEIRFYWNSKGTMRIPNRGDYGSLISAISVNPNFKVCSDGSKNLTRYIVPPVLVACIIFLILIILWWRGILGGRKRIGKEFEGLEFQTIAFSLKQIKAATNNFDAMNKIGEGGFGPVYKGKLADGTVIAVKQLSSRSRQGNREFLNEIGMISCLQHPNLVKLYGCCIEGNQLMVIYEYMENNSLARALLDSNESQSQLMLEWPTRFQICLGIARGLAFLHNESRLKIVHRDIKATNVLLDKDLNPKISDFGLARLHEDEKTHISTKIAGTIGYMAPEYALWGYLTDKADVYSFGVVILEIVSGKSNNNYMPSQNFVCLLDWASHMQESKTINELIDKRMGEHVNRDEAERVVKVALLCTNATPSIRPTMSEVVQMLEGTMAVPNVIPEGSPYTSDVRFRAMKGFHQDKQKQNSTWTQSQSSTTIGTDAGFTSSTFVSGFHEISQDTMPYL